MPSHRGQFRPGDIVAVKRSALRLDESDLSCIHVVRRTGRNEFQVLATAMAHGSVPAFSLWPCCGRIENPRTGDFWCAGHPQDLFTLVKRAPRGAPSAEDALDDLSDVEPEDFLSVSAPIVGPVLHFGRYKKGDKEGIVLRLLGFKPFVLAAKDVDRIVSLARGIASLRKKKDG